MWILEALKNQSESWKSTGNLFLKKGTNPVYMSVDSIMILLEFVLDNNYFIVWWQLLQTDIWLPNGLTTSERNFGKFSYGTRRRESFDLRIPPS